MASKKTLNASNLEALGAARLAGLLMEISNGDAAAKRRLRLELAGAESPAELIREIRKRLATIARSRGFLDWQTLKPFVQDLENQRRVIVQQVAPSLPVEGLDLLWRFLDLSGSVYARCDDSNAVVAEVFRTAVTDLGEIARAAKANPKALADQAFQALTHNDYGLFDGLIDSLKAALGPEGLEHLKQRMIGWSREPVIRPPDKERKAVAWGSSGPIYADDLAERSRAITTSVVLRDIADAQGDVDAFVAQHTENARRMPQVAAEIAQRLLAAGRAQEALKAIEAARTRGDDWPEFEWEDARIAVFEALGLEEKAQEARWSCFSRFLSASHLRAYLKSLPDFDDFEVRERALDHAEQFEDLSRALAFLISWPALDRAARTVLRRADALDGNHYEVLTPGSEALAEKYPLAATLMLRAMIDFALTQNRSSRYGHAARHLQTCARLAPLIRDWEDFPPHDAYVRALRAEHGRKTSFWSLMPA